MAAGRGLALRRCGAGLRSWPEGREHRGVGPGEGRRGRGGRLQPERRGDSEGPGGRRPQGETLQLQGERRLIKLLPPPATDPPSLATATTHMQLGVKPKAYTL